MLQRGMRSDIRECSQVSLSLSFVTYAIEALFLASDVRRQRGDWRAAFEQTDIQINSFGVHFSGTIVSICLLLEFARQEPTVLFHHFVGHGERQAALRLGFVPGVSICRGAAAALRF